MTYAEFLETIRRTLQDALGDDYTLKLHSVPKNNGVLLDGLSIQPPGTTLAPTIYLNSYYHQYQEGMTLEEILIDIHKIFHDNPAPDFISTEAISDFSQIQSKIMMKLIHTDSNRHMLSDLPCIPCLDLSIVFYLLLDRSENGQMTALIHKEHTKLWHTDEQELLRLALINTPVSYPAHLQTMTEVMKSIARSNLGDHYNEEMLDALLNSEESISPLYVLTNTSGIYGASCILYQNILKDFAETLGKDLIILPSSIHEVLITPREPDVSYEELNEMVISINESEVPVEDQLSDHVYVYLRDKDRLQMAVGDPLPQ